MQWLENYYKKPVTLTSFQLDWWNGFDIGQGYWWAVFYVQGDPVAEATFTVPYCAYGILLNDGMCHALTPPSCASGQHAAPDGQCIGPTVVAKENLGVSKGDTNICLQCIWDPINVATGNKFARKTDYRAGGPFPLRLTRYYNSQDSRTATFGNWRGPYSRSISTPSSGVAEATRDDGKVLTFTLTNGAWQANSSVNSRLVKTANGWTYTTSKDETETYDANGRLTAFSNRAGLTQTFSYDSHGNLVSATDPFGRQLQFSYTPASGGSGYLVSEVTVPDGSVYSYGYDSHDNLVSVTHPDGSERQYLYGDSAYPHALTGVIDENGNRYDTTAYDASGRAVSTHLASGVGRHKLDYSDYSAGKVTVTNPLGATYAYSLGAINGLATEKSLKRSCGDCTEGGSATRSTAYDANGNVSKRVDYNGNATTYSYDTSRNLQTSRTDATGRTVTTEWDATYRLPVKITAPNHTTTFTYDSHGNRLTKTITGGSVSRTWTYTYNRNGQVLTVDGPRTDVSDVTTFTYDGQGNLTSVTNALGQVTRITRYDANGRPLSIEDPNGLVTTLTYNFRGQVTSRTVGTERTGYAYDAVGDLTRVTRPDGSFLAFTYDKAHRLVGIRDALGNHIDYTLDGAGNRTQTQAFDPDGALKRSATRVYDELSRLSQAIDAYNNTTRYGYDANGNRLSAADPLGHVTSHTYDALNRLATTQDANGHTTSYTYDNNLHLVGVTDPRSLSTDYTYDAFDERTKVDSPDSGTSTKTYDAAGNVVSATDARGDTTYYTYDALNRLTGEYYADGSATTLQYDQGTNGIGHLTTMTDPSGSTAWTYDIYGHVLRKRQTTGTVTLTTDMTYDAAGRLVSIAYPAGLTPGTRPCTATGPKAKACASTAHARAILSALTSTAGPPTARNRLVVHLAYNANGQVSQMTANGMTLAGDITYRPMGAVSGWVAGNGDTYKRDFDQDGRVAGIDLQSTVSPYSRTLNYDAASRITGITDTSLPSKTFGYDALNRLTSYNTNTASQSYTYDADGNRLDLTTATGGTDYAYAAASNRLLTATGADTTTYEYDAAGHTTAMDAPSAGTGFVYDTRGRLVQSNAGGHLTHYSYNGLGQRVGKRGWGVRKVPGKGEIFLYDHAGHLMGEYTAAGRPVEETVWLGNLPVAVVMPGQKTYFIYPDHLGTPHKIADANGKIVWTWDHGPFGNGQPTGSITYNLRLPGQYYDNETGLNYNYFRDYDPNTGRFVESDPIGLMAGLNTYAYVLNNPINFTDPTGLCLEDACIVEGALLYTAGQALVDALTVGVGTAAIVNSMSNDRPPPGSKGIDETPWSGDHQGIKKGVGAGPKDKVKIDPEGNVWVQNPDGSWTNHGDAGSYTGSGKPSGRKGKDRCK